MPLVEKHAPGDFCWIELATTDQTGAKKFYSELFGWDIHEFTMAPNDFFTFKMDGCDVAAAYTLPAEQRSQGVPAHWKPLCRGGECGRRCRPCGEARSESACRAV